MVFAFSHAIYVPSEAEIHNCAYKILILQTLLQAEKNETLERGKSTLAKRSYKVVSHCVPCTPDSHHVFGPLKIPCSFSCQG